MVFFSNKYFKKTRVMAMALLFLAMYACRQEFEEEFAQVEIINNVPKLVTDIPDVEVALESEAVLDLSAFIQDEERNPITYELSTADASIASATASGSEVTIAGLAFGATVINVTAVDGVSEGALEAVINVNVVANVGPPAKFELGLLGVADGTEFNSLDLGDGVTGNGGAWNPADGSTITVNGGVLELNLAGPDNGMGIELSFDPPLDISLNPILEFEYADALGTTFGVFLSDANGNEGGGEFETLQITPEFKSITVDLGGGDADLTQISSMFFETWGEIKVMKIKSFRLSPPIAPAFQTTFNDADGTEIGNIEVPEGTSVADFSDGGTAAVESGVLVLQTDAIFQFTFDPPLDVTGTPFLRFEYTNAGSDGFAFGMEDAAGGFAEGGFDGLVLGESEANTMVVNLEELGLDASQISTFFVEYFGDGSIEIDNLRIGGSN